MTSANSTTAALTSTGAGMLIRVLQSLRQIETSPGRSEAQNALIALAEYDAGTGNPSRGIESYRDLLGRVLAAKPSPQPQLKDALALSDIYGGAAKLNRQAGQLDAASGLDARRLEIWQIWKIKLPNNDFVTRQIEAVSLSKVSSSAPH
jgi:hypothetical protein